MFLLVKTLLGLLGIFLIAGQVLSQGELYFSNPIIETNSADPAVLKVGDSYYLTLSEDGEKELVIYKSPILTNFRKAERAVAHRCAEGFSDLWASEMHSVDGGLYIYFTMRGESTGGGHRMYVLQANDPSDPMKGWSDPIRLFPNDPDFGGIDGTIFKQGNGKTYYVWTSFAQLYIAEMESPIVVKEPKVMLHEGTTTWEGCREDNSGGCQTEGAYFIYNRNVSYLVYSGGDTWNPNYCLGMMSIYSDLDPMDPFHWRWWPEPVFSRNDEEGVLGPGHASFTVSPDGTETWMMYHAHGNDSTPGRIARIDKIVWGDEDEGAPIFPRPSGYNTVLKVPSGQTSV